MVDGAMTLSQRRRQVGCLHCKLQQGICDVCVSRTESYQLQQTGPRVIHRQPLLRKTAWWSRYLCRLISPFTSHACALIHVRHMHKLDMRTSRRAQQRVLSGSRIHVHDAGLAGYLAQWGCPLVKPRISKVDFQPKQMAP